MSARGTVLVTGASGALGSALVPALREAGWSVRSLRHRGEVPDSDQVVTGDLASGAGLSEAAQGARVIVHAAALTHSRRAARYHEVNAAGTERLVRAALDAGTERFILISTRAISEQGGAYSRSKAAAERAVAGSGLPHCILRLPELYGGGGPEGIDRMIEAARRGSAIPVVGSGEHEMAPAPLTDAIDAICAAADPDRAPRSLYTLAGPPTTMLDAARTAVAALSSSSRIVQIPEPVVRLAAAAARVLPLPVYPDQLDRLRAPKPDPTPEASPDLGFDPPPLEEGLRRLPASHGDFGDAVRRP